MGDDDRNQASVSESDERDLSERAPVDDDTAERARDICARLIADTAVPREEATDLESDSLLHREVEDRLAAVGLKLITNYFAGVFAVRLTREVAADPGIPWAMNRRFTRGALALLVALWARLVLPRRAMMERREELDEGPDLFPAEAPLVRPDLLVHRDALLMEFGDRLGRTNVLRYLGSLRNAGFVEVSHAGEIREGPLLDVLVDGDELGMKLRDSILYTLLGEEGEEDGQEDLPLEEGGG
jgi:hypothetical protein